MIETLTARSTTNPISLLVSMGILCIRRLPLYATIPLPIILQTSHEIATQMLNTTFL